MAADALAGALLVPLTVAPPVGLLRGDVVAQAVLEPVPLGDAVAPPPPLGVASGDAVVPKEGDGGGDSLRRALPVKPSEGLGDELPELPALPLAHGEAVTLRTLLPVGRGVAEPLSVDMGDAVVQPEGLPLEETKVEEEAEGEGVAERAPEVVALDEGGALPLATGEALTVAVSPSPGVGEGVPLPPTEVVATVEGVGCGDALAPPGEEGEAVEEASFDAAAEGLPEGDAAPFEGEGVLLPSERVAADAATPTTRLAVEIRPSFAPRTAARNQPMREAR